MGLFEEATNAASTPIVPQDRFIVECLNLEEAPPYAPPGEMPKPGAKSGVRWILALYYQSTGERFEFQDEPYEFFQTTTANMQRGARAREYAEAFLAREIAEGERLDPNTLIGKKLVGMVIHELTRDKTKKNAKLVAVEPYRVAVVASAPTRSANGSATAVMDRPPAGSAEPSEDDIDRAFLVSSLTKQVERLTRLDVVAGANAQVAVDQSDLNAAPLEDLENLLSEIKAAVQKAMAD